MRHLGIRAKVLLLALIPATVSALLLGGYQLLTATQALQQALDERGQAIVDQLAPAAEYAVFSGHTPVLEELAQAVLREQDVIGVTIRAADNQVLVQRTQAGGGQAEDAARYPATGWQSQPADSDHRPDRRYPARNPRSAAGSRYDRHSLQAYPSRGFENPVSALV